MKTVPILFAFFLVTVLPSCRDTAVERIIFTAPDQSKMEFYLEDGDGRMTSGYKGNHRFREVKTLRFSTLKTSYQVEADGAIYLFPLDHQVEIPE